MSKGELFINGKDAYTEWGLSMDSTSLSTLMTPPPNKSYIKNKSRTQNGARVNNSNPKVDERDLTLQINITAITEEEFFRKYISFCQVLAEGTLDISTKYQPDVIYRTLYESCQQFSEFMRGIGKFILRITEPDPTNRNIS